MCLWVIRRSTLRLLQVSYIRLIPPGEEEANLVTFIRINYITSNTYLMPHWFGLLGNLFEWSSSLLPSFDLITNPKPLTFQIRPIENVELTRFLTNHPSTELNSTRTHRYIYIYLGGFEAMRQYYMQQPKFINNSSSNQTIETVESGIGAKIVGYFISHTFGWLRWLGWFYLIW